MFVQRDFINAFFGHIRVNGFLVLTTGAAIPSFEQAASRERVLSSPARLHSATLPEPEAVLEWQAEGHMIHPPRESAASPQSDYSLAAPPGPRASSEWSQGTEGHWSQFIFPALDESMERSAASMSVDRRSFPTLEWTDEDDERRSISIADWQDADVWSPAPTDNSERRSFPNLEFRGGLRDERPSFPGSELTDGEGPPAAHSQDIDVSSAASTDTLRRRSFPEPELQDGEIGSEHRSFHIADSQQTDNLSRASTNDSGRQSLEFQASEDEAERRSFPGLELRGPYDIIETPWREVATQRVRPFIFTEHNGMTMREKSTFDMENYLREREEWVMMVWKRDVLKTIRFDKIVEHMMLVDDEVGPRKYYLIQRHYAEHFREKDMDNLGPM
jgi:hypothetical protein